MTAFERHLAHIEAEAAFLLLRPVATKATPLQERTNISHEVGRRKGDATQEESGRREGRQAAPQARSDRSSPASEELGSECAG